MTTASGVPTIRRPRPEYKPVSFLDDGDFGWLGGLYGDKKAPVFKLPSKWSAKKLNPRQYEDVVSLVAQHVFVARLRAGLAYVGRDEEFLMDELAKLTFAPHVHVVKRGKSAGHRIVTTELAVDMMRRELAGDEWMDPRDRSVLEAVVHPLLFGYPPMTPLPPPTWSVTRGMTTLTHSVIRAVFPKLGIDAPPTFPGGLPESPTAADVPTSFTVADPTKSTEQLLSLIDLDKPGMYFRTHEDLRRANQVPWDSTTPPPPAVMTLVAPRLHDSIWRLSRPVFEGFRDEGLTRPEKRTRIGLEVYLDRQGAPGAFEGVWRPKDAWFRARIPSGWTSEVGDRLGSLDGRFVFSVLPGADPSRPKLVRALTLQYDQRLNADQPLHRRVRFGVSQFAVSWGPRGGVRLYSHPDGALDWRTPAFVRERHRRRW